MQEAGTVTAPSGMLLRSKRAEDTTSSLPQSTWLERRVVLESLVSAEHLLSNHSFPH